MSKVSAGLVMCRYQPPGIQFLLAHPGGPFYQNKDNGVWTIPKGLVEPGEDILAAAIREFEEETGLKTTGPYLPLGNIKQKGSKIVHAWVFIGAWDDTSPIKSNTFELEWPPKSGKKKTFQEIDRAAWLSLAEASEKIIKEQLPLLQLASEILQKQNPPA